MAYGLKARSCHSLPLIPFWWKKKWQDKRKSYITTCLKDLPGCICLIKNKTMKRKHSHKHPPVCSFLLDEFSSQSNVTEMADNSNIKRGKDNIIRFEFPLEYILFCNLTQVHPALSQLLANLNMAYAVLVADQYICQIQDHLHFINFQQQKVIMIFLQGNLKGESGLFLTLC